jgi:flagellar basal body-associated protein FliL
MANEPAKAKSPAKPQESAAASAAAAAAAPAKKSGSMKMVVLVLLVLVLEGATVFVTMLMAGGPGKAGAESLAAPKAPVEDPLVELVVAKEQFANQRSGRVMIYDTEVYITVHKKDSDRIKHDIDTMQAQLASDLATIFRRADPSYFLEPTLATLTRQIKACLDERLGHDSENNPVIHDAFMKKCIGFQAS